MRKFLAIILVLALAVGATLALTGCNSQTDFPGTRWTNKETLSYEIHENGKAVGALVVITERVAKGETALNVFPEEKYNIDSSANGTRVTMVASDLDGNVWMQSESLLNGFTTVASYKKVSKGENQYTVKARYDGKRYRYSVNGGEEKKIKVKSGFVDNELLYTIVRCYAVESTYSGSFTVVDPIAGSKETIAVSTASNEFFYAGCDYVSGDTTVKGVKCVTGDGVETMKTNIICVKLAFKKSEAPVGKAIEVDYSIEGTDGLSVLGVGEKNLSSTHFPVQIAENNLVYKLSAIEAK